MALRRNMAAVLEKPDAHVPARSGRAPGRKTRHRTLRASLRADTVARDGEDTVRRLAQRLRAAAEDHLLHRAHRTAGEARGGCTAFRVGESDRSRLRTAPQDVA